ncbi:unnamed protein product [Closterium sp. NIES-53]
MAPGQQASAEGMAVEGAEDEGEEDLAATTSVEAAGVADTAMTTRTTDAVADGQEGRGAGGGRGRGRRGRGGRGGGAASMKSTGNESESRDDRFPGQFFFVSTQASAGLEKDEGFEEPAAVGKVTLHSLDYWVIDSGATYSMTPRADLLTELEPSPVKHVTLALGQRAEVKGMGKAMFKGADGKMVGLKNVFWVPNLAANLISVRRLQKAGMDTSSKGAKTYTARLGERILWDLHEDRDVYNEMWQIPVVPIPKERQVAASISTKGEAFGSGDGANGRAKEMKSKKCNLGGTSKLGEHEESGAAAQRQHKGEENPKAEAEEEYGENMWGTIASAAFSNPTSATGECDWLTLHRRMGHVALPILQQLVKDEMVAGIRVKGGPDECAAPHSSSFPPTSAPLQTLHMDVWGPTRVSGQGRERYFLLVVDDYTPYTTVFPLRTKGERRIGLVMEVARTSMIHAAAPHFLWPFAVWYAAHHLNLWPRVSLQETSPTLCWTRKVGDASVNRDWGSRAFVRDSSTDKLSARANPCIFLGFSPDAPGWKFYHPTSRRVFPSQDITPPPPQGPAPSGASQVDPLPSTVPIEVAVDSGAARGAASGGAEPRGAERGGAESEGAGFGGAEPGGAEPAGAEPAGVESRGTEPEGVEPGGAGSGGAEPRGTASSGGPAGASQRLSPRLEPLSAQQLHKWFTERTRLRTGATGVGDSPAGDTGAGGVGVTAGAGGTGGAAAAGLGGARTRGTGAAGTGSVGGAGAVDSTKPRAAGAGGSGAGGAGAGGAGAGGTGVLGVPSSPGLTPPLLYPPPDQSQLPLQPASPLPVPSPYTEPASGLTERREPASRPASPVCTCRCVPRPPPPPVPGSHAMAIRPSSIPLRVPQPPPPESSLPTVPDPVSDCARAAIPTIFFESTAASALLAELVDFAAACRLDYATALVAESESASPPSSGTDVLEERQEDFECLVATVPRFASMLLAPEGDPDAPDIPTPRSYAEAITGTYVDALPPSGANIVDGMWIFRVKRPPGSPLAFKPRYVARGFSQRQGVDYFQTFSPTPKMTTLRVLLHVAAQRDYELHSLDFSTAFLQGSLNEEIWLCRPPGFTGSFPAGTQWSLRRPLPPFYVLVYIDNLVFATTDTKVLILVKSELPKRHTCTDLGELRSYLGLQITRDRARRTITLTQSHMVHQVLQRFGFQFSSPQHTPLSTGPSLSAPNSDESIELSCLYPELVVCLMYLMTCTRPDLAYPLSLLVRYVAPDNKAMNALCQEHKLEHRTKHIALRYFLARELQQRGQLRLAYVATRANTADVFTKALPPRDHQRFSTVLGLLRDTGPEVELMRSVLDRKRPQKMGSSRMDHGGTSNLRNQANATLSNPILLRRGRKHERLADALVSTELLKQVGRELTAPIRVQTQDWQVPTKPLAQLATSSTDPRDQNTAYISLAPQGEDSGVPYRSPYSGPTRGLTERREPESCPVSPESRPALLESRSALPVRTVRVGRRVSRPHPPPVPGTHSMTLRPSTAPQRVPLTSPPASSLPDGPDPQSDSLRAASPTITRFLATAVTDPLFESTAASALVAELIDFVAACRLDYATSLVAEYASTSVCPPSVGGECALGTDVLEDRQEEFECFAVAVPHLVSMLLVPEGDPDAPDIPTPRSYEEAIEGTYVDEVPPPGANIVSGMWIFRVKRPAGSPPVFKARYVARGFSQRLGVDFFQTFSPTPKMTTLRCGPKAWKILKDVHAPSSEAMVVVLERQLHAVKINEGDAVQGAFDQLRDLYVKLSAAGVDYPEKIKCYKALPLLPESWGPLVVNLNGMKDSWSLEWIRAQVLQEEFRRKELTATADEGGSSAYGMKGFKGRGSKKGKAKEGSGGEQYSGGKRSNKGGKRCGGKCWYCHVEGYPWFKCRKLRDGWRPGQPSIEDSKGVHGAMGEGMGSEEGDGGAGGHGGMFYHVGEACSEDMVVPASKVSLHRSSH